MHNTRLIILCSLATWLTLTPSHLFVSCHLITIEPNQEECFHEKLQKGTKIKFTFEVLDGGSLDVDLSIKDPNNYVIHSEERHSSGKYTIEANQNGRHTYCFGNKMSSFAIKIVMFNVEFTDAKIESDQEHDRLNDMVTELTGMVTGLKHEMEFLAARDTLHRRISEHINSRVGFWTIFETVLLLAVTVGQLYYIKNFFEVKRTI